LDGLLAETHSDSDSERERQQANERMRQRDARFIHSLRCLAPATSFGTYGSPRLTSPLLGTIAFHRPLPRSMRRVHIDVVGRVVVGYQSSPVHIWIAYKPSPLT